MKHLRTLIWIYLWLLIFEGALRKWVVPALDAPLLVIRDPLVIWIYYQAVRNRLSFNNAFFLPTVVLAAVTAILSTLFGVANVLVTIYGLRTDFLQIPLIFLIPQILNRNDIITMGRLLLYISLPIAALVILQFRSPPDSFLNKGTMATHYGTVRPSGPFSFGTGLSSYFTLASAFLLYGYIQTRTYKIWLMAPVTFAILLAAACSGSRSCLVLIGLVTAVAVLCVVARGKGGMGIMIAAVLIALAIPILSSTSIGQEGTEQLQERFQDAGKVEGGAEGFVDRFINSMVGPVDTVNDVPFFGYGLGVGTNASAGLYHSDRALDWPEAEWARLIFESGAIFGILLCIFRAALTLAIARSAFLAFRRDNILPILIFASCGLLILNGQWGVPTTLGFAIFGAGITLAACEDPPEEEDEDEEQEDGQVEGEPDHFIGGRYG